MLLLDGKLRAIQFVETNLLRVSGECHVKESVKTLKVNRLIPKICSGIPLRNFNMKMGKSECTFYQSLIIDYFHYRTVLFTCQITSVSIFSLEQNVEFNQTSQIFFSNSCFNLRD